MNIIGKQLGRIIAWGITTAWLLSAAAVSAGGQETVRLLPLLVAAPPIPQAVVSEAAQDAPVELLHPIAIDAEGRTLFLGTHLGLFRSDDGGYLWRRVRLA